MASAQQPPGPDGEGSDLLRDDRGAPVPDVYGHPREPRAQQHPGEPEGPRGGHALHGRAADQPADRGRDAAELHADHGVEVHARPRDRGGPVRAPGARCRSSRRRSPTGHHDAGVGSRARRQGRPIALRTIQGATTIELTTQAALAAKSSSLWIQGGTTTDPVLRTGRSPTSSGSAHCAARSTTSTATTSSGSSSRPAAGTSTATRTT